MITLDYLFREADLTFPEYEHRHAGTLLYDHNRKRFYPGHLFLGWRPLAMWETIQPNDRWVITFPPDLPPGHWTPDAYSHQVWSSDVGEVAGDQFTNSGAYLYRSSVSVSSRGNRHYAKGLPLP